MWFHYNSGFSFALTGKKHLLENKPCQDFSKYAHNNSIQVIALADGAGCSNYSQIGSKITTEMVCKLILEKFNYLIHLSTSEISSSIVTEIQVLLSSEADKQGLEVRDLSSTLLFAATDGDKLLYGHIGDGYIVRVVNNEPTEVLSYPDNGEYANQTYFITNPDAASLLKVNVVPMHRESIIYLLSDGPSAVLFQKKPFEISSVFQNIFKWISDNSTEKAYEAILENFKDSISVRTNDDCSLALMYSSSILFDEFSHNSVSKLEEAIQQASIDIPFDVIVDFLRSCLISKKYPLKIDCNSRRVKDFKTKDICNTLTDIKLFENKDGNKLVFCNTNFLRRLF